VRPIYSRGIIVQSGEDDQGYLRWKVEVTSVGVIVNAFRRLSHNEAAELADAIKRAIAMRVPPSVLADVSA